MNSYRQVVRLEGVSGLLLAAGLARLAARMLALALVLYALARFHSSALAGWIGFAAMAPGLLVSPVAGALLDRLGSGPAIAIDMACGAACVLCLGLLAWAGEDRPPAVLVLTALYSLTTPLSAAGIRSLLPALVPEFARDRANALDMANHAATEVAGPALAGLLFSLTGAAPTLLTIGALFVLAGISIAPAARRNIGSERPWRGGLLTDSAAGVAYVLRHKALRGLALGYATYQAAWGILLVAVPVWVTHSVVSGRDADSVVGLLWALSGIAGSFGALAAGRFGARGRERSIMVTAVLLTALAAYPVCVAFGLPGLAIGLALVGLLSGPADVGVLTLRQRCTDPAWLGRVMAVSMSLNLSGLPIGYAIGGVLSARSVPVAFAAAALACLISAALLRWLLPSPSR